MLQKQALPVIALLFAIGIWPVQADEQCEFSFTDCPENFHGDTIPVPENVIQLSANVKACPASMTTTGEELSAPSVVFVIDHSGSMTGEGQGNNDVMGSRFTVTKDLLDTIYTSYPEAEVGLVVFREHLYFDVSSDEYFARYFQPLDKTYDDESDQAYLPPLQLNRSYDGKNGIDIIKDVLETDTIRTGGLFTSSRYVDLAYKPSFESSLATNINVAFIAARAALSNAAAAPERQFVIFLSDGEPMGESQAGLPENDFVNGEDLPTSFTVFFTRDDDAPQSLEDMTENIRENGYSATNPQSDLWAIETNYDALMGLLMENVIGTILVSGNPIGMAVNKSAPSVTYENGEFVFPSAFPLEESLSAFTLDINYRLTDESGGAIRDTVKTITFHVQREEDARTPRGIELNCWDTPTDPPDSSGNPTQPSDTADSTGPTQPSDTADSTGPTQPSDTADSTGPTQPSDTADSSGPTQPSDTADSSGPGGDPGVSNPEPEPSTPPLEVTVGVSENPFIPGKTVISSRTRRYYSEVIGGKKRGIVIGISVSEELEPDGRGWYGTAEMYDPVGNLLVSELPVEAVGKEGEYGIFWEGMNDNGRFVGPGAYLMIVYLKDINGKRSEKRIKIGVKMQ